MPIIFENSLTSLVRWIGTVRLIGVTMEPTDSHGQRPPVEGQDYAITPKWLEQ